LIVYPEGTWYSGVKPEDVPEIIQRHLKQGAVVSRLVNSDITALKTEIDSSKAKMIAANKARDEAGVLPDDMMQAFRGFMESRILLSSIELDLYTAVGDGSTAIEIAGKLGTDLRAAEAILNAVTSMGLLSKDGGIFRNSSLASHYFVAGAPADNRENLKHLVNLWPRWSTLTDCVRQGTAVTYREMGERGDDWTTAFIAAMHRNALLRAPIVLKAIQIEKVKTMLDVGGGSGAYSIAFAQANGKLKAEVFDLPSVIPLAQRHINEAGLEKRVIARAGDFRKGDLGADFDLIFISAICHMNGPEDNRDLFKKSFKALVPGGQIVVQDFILEPDRTAPRSAAIFAINMLVGTLHGGTYTEEEYSTWLRESGFVDVRRIRLPGPSGLMIARRLS